jgi:hypothetical protein
MAQRPSDLDRGFEPTPGVALSVMRTLSKPDSPIKQLLTPKRWYAGPFTSVFEPIATEVHEPTSSILSPRRTVDRRGADTDIVTRGATRPLGEAMMAYVLADHFLRHRGPGGWLDIAFRAKRVPVA